MEVSGVEKLMKMCVEQKNNNTVMRDKCDEEGYKNCIMINLNPYIYFFGENRQSIFINL